MLRSLVGSEMCIRDSKRPADLNWTDVAVVITDTSYTVTGLTNNQERQFRIRAIANGNPSKWTDPIAITPTANTQAPGLPSRLRETVDREYFDASWDPASQVLDYQLRYREGNGPWTTLVGLTTTSRRISGLTPNRTYHWQVRSRNTFNGESFSNWAPGVCLLYTSPSPRDS